MKITVAKSSGFCFGVERALKIARDLATAGNDVRMLGDIVHNENVVQEMESAGIRKIKRLGKGVGKTLLIRAHGASKKTIESASGKNYKIVDATCPMVREIHKIAIDMHNKGYRVIVIGDKKHDEVLGIVGQIDRKALVVGSADDIQESVFRRIRKAAVVVQSTQSMENVSLIMAKLKKLIPDLVFHNTICNTTRRKQAEIKKMPLRNDVVIIIGSKTSANTLRLYEISKSLNKRTYRINSGSDIQGRWFRNASSVGIMAGASTPDYTTREVINSIKKVRGKNSEKQT